MAATGGQLGGCDKRRTAVVAWTGGGSGNREEQSDLGCVGGRVARTCS